MTKTHFRFGCQGAISFHPEVPFLRMPKVKLVGEYYEDEEGKKYVPELFDRMFKSVKSKIKGTRYKGEIIGSPLFESIEL